MNEWTAGYRRGDHAIQVYQTDAEREGALLELVEWSRNDEKIIYFTDKLSTRLDNGRENPLIEKLSSEIENGRLEIKPSFSSYCPGGKFRGPEMFGIWEEIHADALEQGHGGVIGIGDVSWLKTHMSVFLPFMRYEQGIDFARLPKDVTILCQYDQRLFTSEQLNQAAGAHQLRLSAGRLERNYWLIMCRSTEQGYSPESLRQTSVISGSFIKRF
ncbi:MAG: MEDS domain-containing protein [Methanomassiliicoccales archaeon]|jgi:hypothetical protein